MTSPSDHGVDVLQWFSEHDPIGDVGQPSARNGGADSPVASHGTRGYYY